MGAEFINKSQPTMSGVHINAPLTNVSIAYIQDEADFVADKVFPVVPVKNISNIFYKMNKSYWFRSEAKERAEGTESVGSGFGLDRDTYMCHVYALHSDLSDQQVSNADSVIELESTTAIFVTQQLLLVKEKKFADAYFKTGVWSKDYVGVETKDELEDGKFLQWDNPDSDPYNDIRKGRMKIKKSTGYRPNKMVISEEVFEVLCMHPKIKEMYKYVSSDSINTKMLANYFKVDEILIAGAVENTSVESVKEDDVETDMNFFLNNGILLVYVAKKVGPRIPTAGITFSWIGGVMGGFATTIKKFYMQWLESTRIEGQTAFEHKLVAKDLGVYFSNVISAED